MSRAADEPVHHVDVHVILRRGDEILMGRRAGGLVFEGCFQIPLGRLEEGESATRGAARELLEETGVHVRPEDLRFVHVMHHRVRGYTDRIAFFFEAVTWSGAITNPEPDKCDGWLWANLTHPPHPIASYLNRALAHYLNGVHYSEYAWDLGFDNSVKEKGVRQPGR